MNFIGNDHIAEGTVTVEVSQDRRMYVAPVSIEFCRDGVTFGFNMQSHEAKRLALYILEQL